MHQVLTIAEQLKEQGRELPMGVKVRSLFLPLTLSLLPAPPLQPCSPIGGPDLVLYPWDSECLVSH